MGGFEVSIRDSEFLGFIDNFSRIVVPLTRLTTKTITFSWELDQQENVETMRQRLCEALILTLP